MLTTDDNAKPSSSKVVFFLGAGASKDAGIPTTFEFVDEFLKQPEEQLGNEDRAAVEIVREELCDFLKRTAGAEAKVDIERLMETLEKLANRENEALLQFCQVSTIKADFNYDWTRLLELLQNFMRRKCQVTDSDIAYLKPLVEFIDEYKESPLDVFTTNYDTTIEQFCKVYRKRYRDGFDPYWNPDDFEKPDTNVRLYKIHGSITWFKTETGDFVKNIFEVEDTKTRLLSGEDAQPLMLYPMRKWEYQEPLLENLLTLKRKLQATSCEIIVVVGYSFRDDHIRDIFWDAAKANRNSTLVLITPSAYQIYRNRLKYFDTAGTIPSSLSGRVVCLPFKLSNCFSRFRLTFVENLLKGAEELKKTSDQHLKEPDSTGWAPCMIPYSKALHVEMTEKILKERMDLKEVTEDAFNDAKKMEDRFTHFVFKSLHENPVDLIEILHSRAMAYEFNEAMFQYKSALFDMVVFVDYLFRNRMRFRLEHNFLNLTAHYPENWAPDLTPPLDLNEFIKRQKGLRVSSYRLFMGLVETAPIPVRPSFLKTTFVATNLHEYFLRWKQGQRLDDYVRGKEVNFPVEMNSAFGKYKATGVTEPLLSEIDKYERGIFNQIIEDVKEHLRSGKAIPLRDGLHDYLIK